MISIYPKVGDHATVNHPFSVVGSKKFSNLADYVSKYTWSPCFYRDDLRREDHFMKAILVGLDFDDGMSLMEAKENIFCDMRHIIGTTRSHRIEKNGIVADRFRVILQFSEPIVDLRTYKYNLDRLVRHYGADENARGAARLFYPCREIVSVSDGYFVDVETPPEGYMNYSARDAELAAFSRLGEVPIWLQRELCHPVLPGNRNNAVFSMCLSLSKLKWDQDYVRSMILGSRVYKDNISDRNFIRGVESTINSLFRRGIK